MGMFVENTSRIKDIEDALDSSGAFVSIHEVPVGVSLVVGAEYKNAVRNYFDSETLRELAESLLEVADVLDGGVE